MKKFVLFSTLALFCLSGFSQQKKLSFSPSPKVKSQSGFKFLADVKDTASFMTTPLQVYSWHDYSGNQNAIADYKRRGIIAQPSADPSGHPYVYLKQHVTFPFDGRNCRIIYVYYNCVGSGCPWSYGVTPTSGYNLDYQIDPNGQAFYWERLTQASGAAVTLTVYYQKTTPTK